MREYNGLKFIEQHLGSLPGFGAVHPVSVSESPKYVVTSFHEGRSLRAIVEDAVARGRPDTMNEAAAHLRAVARWLAALRRVEPIPDATLSAESVIGDIAARAAEMPSQFRAAADHGVAVSSSLIEALTEAERALTRIRFASHGDLAPQNFIVEPSGRLVPIDLESFDHRPLDIDVAGMRTRLEHAGLLGRVARLRAESLWRAFIDGYVKEGASPRFAAVCYLHRLFANLAWETATAKASGRAGGRSLRTRIRTWLWVRNRLAWLKGLTLEDGEIQARFMTTL
jgi:aminoglycoside phosphotransferase (APT) family kinase protein